METQHIKNIIIGFGKAGKTLAGFLAQKGEEVVLIERQSKMYGGTCINIGCIPSKSLISLSQKGTPLPEAIAITNELTAKLRDANYGKLDQMDTASVLTGTAHFLNNKTIEVSTPEGKKRFTAERIFINTGAKPSTLDIPGADLPKVYNSTSIMQIQELPKRLAIIGGGFIGIEFASMFSDFGSEVTILDSEEKFLQNEDEDMRTEILKMFAQKNIAVKNNSRTQAIENQTEQLVLKTETEEITADAVLVAIGRTPNTEDLGLENTDIVTNERGAIEVDDELKTAVKNIWALGDINGGPQFTYISLDDFRLVRNQLFGGDYTKRSQRKPFATSSFITPPYSHIGKREKDFVNTEDIIVKKIPTNAIPKAKILGETDGLLKAIIDKKTKKILGCTLFCTHSPEIINIAKTAMDNDLTADILANQIFTHPTLAEALNDLFTV